jgi:hypothetical protein
MSHMPINHPLRPLYRFLAGVAGLYVLIFGIVGLTQTSGSGFFGREDTSALGLRTNAAFSVLSIVVGAVVFVGAIYGHNLDHFINLVGGLVFLVAGLAMLTLLRTPANFLNFTVTTCVASYIIGTVLFAAGMYGKTGPEEAMQDELRVSGRAG